MTIIAKAAIHTEDGVVHTVERPMRHPDIICDLQAKSASFHNSTQGFVTDESEFVDRREAYKIAKAAGQLVVNQRFSSTPGTLYTEDLW